MKNELPIFYLARHDETAWSPSGQHTGLTDLPLTTHGEHTARQLGERLKGLTFAKVFTSPLQRARQTCDLSGFGAVAEIDPDLLERNYGKYEGRRGDEICAERPDSDEYKGHRGKRGKSGAGRSVKLLNNPQGSIGPLGLSLVALLPKLLHPYFRHRIETSRSLVVMPGKWVLTFVGCTTLRHIVASRRSRKAIQRRPTRRYTGGPENGCGVKVFVNRGEAGSR